MQDSNNEIWFMDLEYVDNLAKNNGVEYQLFRQDLIERTITIDPKGMKTTDAKQTVCAFSFMITKKTVPESFGSKR